AAVYVLPGGGSCSVSGTNPSLSTVTISCSSVNLSSHSRVYFGIKNDVNANGNTMTGAAPASGAGVYGFSGSSASTITYASTTTVANQIAGTQNVTSTLTLSKTGGGTVTVVSTGGTSPADNGNGAIQRLFRLDSGSSFTFTAVVNAATTTGPAVSGIANPGVYDV